jgi:hypothetical protein
MKLLISILAVVGTFLTVVGLLPPNGDIEDRMSSAMTFSIGVGILVCDALVLIVWLILNRSV